MVDMRMMIAALCVMGSAVSADTLTCSFDTECLDTDGCDATAYEAVVSSGADDFAVMSDMNGDTEGTMNNKAGYYQFKAGAF